MDIDFNKNEDFNKLAVSEIKHRLEKYISAAVKKIEKQHAKGKMTARERIDYLIDKETKITEIGAFAGEGMYDAYGGCPSGGVVVVLSYVEKRLCGILLLISVRLQYVC